jgi:hypothetical protein
MKRLSLAAVLTFALSVPALALECTGTPGIKLVPVFVEAGAGGVKWTWKGAAFTGQLNAGDCTLAFNGQEGDRVIVNLIGKPEGSVVMRAGLGRDLAPLTSGSEVLIGKTGKLVVQLSRAEGTRGSVGYDLAWDFIYKVKP